MQAAAQEWMTVQSARQAVIPEFSVRQGPAQAVPAVQQAVILEPAEPRRKRGV
ncbi:MAG: hypothetical protein AABY87_06620 [bacterium]